MDVFALPPRKVKTAIEHCMKARLVPFIQSSPGIGKSSIVKEIAKEYNLKLIDCRLSSMEPTDLVGLPWIENGVAKFNPYNVFPLEGTEIPEGYEGFLLFLDEFNSASRATQAAAYRVVLDREVGQHKLHSHCFVVAAGNKMSDNAIVNRLSTAMSSRVIHLNMEVNFEDWRDNFAIPNKVDERIIAYLSVNNDRLMRFDPDKDDQTFTCPRTWEFASKLLKTFGNRQVNTKDIALLGGAITVEEASAFVQFCRVYKDIITIEKLLANPDIEAPTDIAITWATVIHLINKTDKDNSQVVLNFIDRLPTTFKIVFMRSIKKNNPSLLLEPHFISAVTKLGNYCFGD